VASDPRVPFGGIKMSGFESYLGTVCWNLLTCRQLDFMMSWFTNTMWNRKIGTENNACSQ
jgi:hypothetical protein